MISRLILPEAKQALTQFRAIRLGGKAEELINEKLSLLPWTEIANL